MKKRTSTNKIILHCSATAEGKDFKAADIDKWHKNNGWECIGYHYVIDLDGTIEKGRDEEMVGAHTSGYNANSIGICYIGGVAKDGKTAKDTRTPEQKQSLVILVNKLLQKYHLKLDNVYCHNSFTNAKACPSFKLGVFRQEYDDWLKEQHKNICPYCGHELP
jgi:N-acetylmuramoyl-L-alanine amidase